MIWSFAKSFLQTTIKKKIISQCTTYKIERGHNRNVFYAIVHIHRRNCYFMTIFMTSMNFIDVLILSPKYLFFRMPIKRQIFSSSNGYYLLKAEKRAEN